jgi:glycosyltransferase involved in cell wall biosynthesis
VHVAATDGPKGTARRVAVDGRHLCGQRTGIGVWLGELVSRWAAAGHAVSVLVPDGCELPLQVHTVPLRGPFHLSALRWARRERCAYLSPDSLIVPSLLGRSAAVAVHDLVPLELPDLQHLRARLAYRFLLGAATRRCGLIIVPSDATRRDLTRRFADASARTHVVPEAARTLPPAGPLPEGVRPPFVLFAATLEPRKRPAELVRAFARGAPEGWQLVLAGKRGWLPREDVSTLEHFRGSDRVVELGYVSDATLAALLVNASILAYPTAYEGFGLPVLEGMAAGVAVLATTTPAVREVAGEAAMLVELDGNESFEDRLGVALRRLMSDAELRADLAAAGRMRAAQFSWDTAAAAVWALLIGLAGTRP